MQTYQLDDMVVHYTHRALGGIEVHCHTLKGTRIPVRGELRYATLADFENRFWLSGRAALETGGLSERPTVPNKRRGATKAPAAPEGVVTRWMRAVGLMPWTLEK